VGPTGPEVTDIVPKAGVPLAPPVAEPAHPVPVRTQIPRLGDQLAAGQNRVIGQPPQMLGLEVLVLTTQRHTQIEAESVDVEGRLPPAQRLEDGLAERGMVGGDGIAGPGPVDVIALTVESVPTGVVEALHGE